MLLLLLTVYWCYLNISFATIILSINQKSGRHCSRHFQMLGNILYAISSELLILKVYQRKLESSLSKTQKQKSFSKLACQRRFCSNLPHCKKILNNIFFFKTFDVFYVIIDILKQII